jgi:adenylate cyclase
MRKGASPEAVDHALARGRVDVLAVDTVVLPGPPRFTLRDVAERAGLPAEVVERLWRALGFAAPEADDAVVFGDVDVEALVVLRKLIERGVTEPEAAVQLARVVGTTMAQLAEAMIGARAVAPVGADERLVYAEAVLGARDNVLQQTARLLEYTWRRHIQAAARRRMGAEPAEDGLSMVSQTVGFADLVGYTALSQQLDEHGLAAVVGRFQELAHDVVAAAGGRIIKTIGDEVMYLAAKPVIGVHVALALAEAYADDDLLSELRIGLATGPVLAKDGDYYGPVVNLASRLVSVAYPGTVVVSSDMHDALAAEAGLAWRPLRSRRLKDIGTVPLWAVYRSGNRPPPGAVRKRFLPLRTLLADAGVHLAERRAVDASSRPEPERGDLGRGELERLGKGRLRSAPQVDDPTGLPGEAQH